MMSLRLGVAGEPLRIAAIGAHCDDVPIGAGGLLLAASQRPATEISVLVLTSNARRAAEERAALTGFCGDSLREIRIHDLPDGRLPGYWNQAKDHMMDFARSVDVDLVVAPSPHDAHQDHRLLGEMAITAFRDHVILHYEIPKWDGDLGAGRPNLLVPLTSEQMNAKWLKLHEHYSSQRPHDWFDEQVFRGLARLRGVEARAPYAEAFTCSKALVTL